MDTTRELISEASPNLRRFLVSLDEFEKGKAIGEGAFGKVYLGVHKPTGIECGIKILLATHLEERDKVDLLRETGVMAEVSDLFVLPFLGWTATYPYAVITQYASGGCLFNALRGKEGSPKLTPTVKTIIMIGVAKGMLALHKKKIIHRDLKSLNVLLDERCFPKICDFGLSIVDSEVAMKTKDIGTPHWMAPELFESNDYTNKVDVYAYGILLWEILTGSTPYKGKSGLQIAMAVCQRGERPAFPKNTPKKIQNFIKQCWHQIPSKRPSFQQIVTLLSNKTIFFPGTDLDELDFFFDQVAEEEQMRKQGQGVGVKPLGNPLFVAQMCQGIDTGTTKSDEANPAELSNPLCKNYEKNFKMCVKLYTTPDNVKQFFEMLIPAILKDEQNSISNFILAQCLRLITKEDYIFNAFFSSKMFGSLPTNRKDIANSIFNILNVFFTKKPEAVDCDLLNYFSPLTQFAPHKMLKLIMLNLDKFGQLANGWDLCRFLIYLAPTMIRSDIGNEYIQLLMKMIKTQRQFAAQYIKDCAKIFVAAIQQFKPEISNTGYAALLQINDGSLALLPDIVAKSLSTEGCEKGALAYLLTSKNIALSPQIIDSLCTLSAKSKEAMALLLWYTERNDSFICYFPDYRGSWLVDGRLSIEASSQLMAALMCHKEFRPYMAHVFQLPQWLCLLAQSMVCSTIGLTSVLVAKIGITADFIRKLQVANFFKFFIDGVINLNDERLYQSTSVLIDGCSRIADVDDFSKYDQTLVEIGLKEKGGDNPNLYLCAISALAMRSLHRPAVEHIKTVPKVGKLITQLQSDPKANPFITILWKNCST